MSMIEIFGEPISVYTVEQGVADGLFVQLDPQLCAEAGYSLPVVLTRAAWADLVEWKRGPYNDETGRTWDVLTMARGVAKASLRDQRRRNFWMYRVPHLTPSGRPSTSCTAQRVQVSAVVQAWNTEGAACVTILLPTED